jgi:hypothetical protein
MQGDWFQYAVASATALAIAVGLILFMPAWRESMEITEGSPYQGLSSQFASRWRRFAQAWPLFVVVLGVVLSVGWIAILVWVVWGLIDLAT